MSQDISPTPLTADAARQAIESAAAALTTGELDVPDGTSHNAAIIAAATSLLALQACTTRDAAHAAVTAAMTQREHAFAHRIMTNDATRAAFVTYVHQRARTTHDRKN